MIFPVILDSISFVVQATPCIQWDAVPARFSPVCVRLVQPFFARHAVSLSQNHSWKLALLQSNLGPRTRVPPVRPDRLVSRSEPLPSLATLSHSLLSMPGSSANEGFAQKRSILSNMVTAKGALCGIDRRASATYLWSTLRYEYHRVSAATYTRSNICICMLGLSHVQRSRYP